VVYDILFLIFTGETVPITMITGGAGAGKTAHALKLADQYTSKTYIATAVCTDDEMRAKIDAHIAERDESYATIEEPVELADALGRGDGDVVIIDCITFWVNNLIYYEKDAQEYFDRLIDALQSIDKPVILVTNEVGLGIIPWDEQTRKYAKLLAKINKQIAHIADSVTLMVSGIPVKVK
jgi:adenosylcobinamide kinase/adenosylcobinamide-phosphate guanylyltransferase